MVEFSVNLVEIVNLNNIVTKILKLWNFAKIYWFGMVCFGLEGSKFTSISESVRKLDKELVGGGS